MVSGGVRSRAKVVLFSAGAAPSASAAFSVIEFFYGVPFNGFMVCNNKLGDAFTVLNSKGFVREVDERYPNLASVVGIDSSWCIDDRYSVLCGHA